LSLFSWILMVAIEKTDRILPHQPRFYHRAVVIDFVMHVWWLLPFLDFLATWCGIQYQHFDATSTTTTFNATSRSTTGSYCRSRRCSVIILIGHTSKVGTRRQSEKGNYTTTGTMEWSTRGGYTSIYPASVLPSAADPAITGAPTRTRWHVFDIHVDDTCLAQ
jgi:hypothetical protein